MAKKKVDSNFVKLVPYGMHSFYASSIINQEEPTLDISEVMMASLGKAFNIQKLKKSGAPSYLIQKLKSVISKQEPLPGIKVSSNGIAVFPKETVNEKYIFNIENMFLSSNHFFYRFQPSSLDGCLEMLNAEEEKLKPTLETEAYALPLAVNARRLQFLKNLQIELSKKIDPDNPSLLVLGKNSQDWMKPSQTRVYVTIDYDCVGGFKYYGIVSDQFNSEAKMGNILTRYVDSPFFEFDLETHRPEFVTCAIPPEAHNHVLCNPEGYYDISFESHNKCEETGLVKSVDMMVKRTIVHREPLYKPPINFLEKLGMF